LHPPRGLEIGAEARGALAGHPPQLEAVLSLLQALPAPTTDASLILYPEKDEEERRLVDKKERRRKVSRLEVAVIGFRKRRFIFFLIYNAPYEDFHRIAFCNINLSTKFG
jgi:hypothetical protein